MKVVICPNCGPFRITTTALGKISGPRASAIISHSIRLKGHDGDLDFPLINSEMCESLIQANYLPSYIEQADALLSLIAAKLERDGSPGGRMEIYPPFTRAEIGCASERDVNFLIDELLKAGLLSLENTHPNTTTFSVANHSIPLDANYAAKVVGLTFEGWNRIEEINKTASDKKSAFIAMQYGDPQLDEIVTSVFRPACEDTGFRLKRLDDEPKAGIIDNHLRIEIRNCRFLLADLSHGNKGAYWEAGYAEGLGRPVIYLCEKDVFSAEKSKPHFDTNHCQTVVWSYEDPEGARRQLADCIRATLPLEAIMPDD